MGAAEMSAIGALIGRVLRSPSDEETIATVRAEVRELCKAFDPYPGGPAL
jgi:glycine/serine hydroxymethyltransferase